MPSCVVPGCTSGYGSNPERVHFFTIPKNPDAENLWKTAIRRSDKFIKSGRPVCEKHFLKKQIIWSRKLLDAAGRVLGVTQYKIPRLKEGSVPSIFSWTENLPVEQPEDLGEATHEETMSSSASNDIAEPQAKVQKLESSHDSVAVDAISTLAERNLIQDKTGSIQDETEKSSMTLQFTELSTIGLSLPSGWISKNSVVEGDKLFICVCHETIKIEGHYHTFVSKEITVSEDLSVVISVYGRVLNHTNFDVPNYLTSLKSLEEIISSINRLNICKGYNVASGSSMEQDVGRRFCSTTKKDITGTWRHINCPGLLKNTMICPLCRSAKKCLANILRKRKINENKEKKIHAVNVKDEKLRLQKLKRKYQNAIRAKFEARDKIKTLKSTIQEDRLKMKRLSMADLEQLVEDGNVGQNQLHVLKQIVNAAKRKNSKGRKYSEKWILLCMLMHMRSPSNYEFLRSNQILPLPCARTIRRYV